MRTAVDKRGDGEVRRQHRRRLRTDDVAVASLTDASLRDEVLPAAECDASAWSQTVVEMGEALAVGSAVLADGRIDAAESVKLSKELGDVIKQATALQRRLAR